MVNNITCRICTFRHSPLDTCEQAKAKADIARGIRELDARRLEEYIATCQKTNQASATRGTSVTVKDFVQLLLAGHSMLERFALALCDCGCSSDPDIGAHADNCKYRETLQ